MAAAVQSGPPPGLGLPAHSSPSLAAMVSRPLPLPVPPSLMHHHAQGGMDSTANGPPNPEVLLALLSRNKNLEAMNIISGSLVRTKKLVLTKKPLMMFMAEKMNETSGQASIPKCGGCQELILDRFILKVLDRTWHAKCLNCNDCGGPLTDKCFARNGQVFCKDDFFKRFGTKCAGCDQGIPPTQVVRRAQDNVYHLQCFACAMCARQLNTGDEFYLMEDRKLVCKPDYEAAKTKDGVCLDGDQPNKRPRTTITAKQLETLKSAYNNSPKPARHVREQLSQDTGLDMRVVQVWFQNRRAKEKRLKKDAGRTKWSQYFRSMKGGSSPRDKILDDKDDLRVELDSSFSHSHDLGSNDSYGTVVDMGLTVDGSSPRQGHYLHGGSATPPYLSSSHSPPSGHSGIGHQFSYQSEGLSIYTSLGQSHGSGMMGPGPAGPPSDVSDASSAQGYPEFPPSPDSWLGENTAPRY